MTKLIVSKDNETIVLSDGTKIEINTDHHNNPVGFIVTESPVPYMTEDEKVMTEALARISTLAKSWEGRSEAPYWNLGDIASAALVRVANSADTPPSV